MTIHANFVGNIGADAELRHAAGTPVCSFRVAVQQGFGDKATTDWVRVDLWGKRGESVQPYILKGGEIFVSGELSTDEYQGKTQLRCRANDVKLIGKRRDSGGGGHAPRADTGRPAPAFDPDLDSDVPFIRSDCVF